ncbi:MAG: hypothetical protein LCH84_14435 [Gemmatimonadetes bacterium]|nr:hypothetical protein [Gemmatimonadota bacterium]
MVRVHALRRRPALVSSPQPHRVIAVAVLALTIALTALPATLTAQIRGQPPTQRSTTGGSTGWWFSGGASALTLGDISDGRSNTRWQFGSDPLWLFRGTLEKALDDATTLGVAAAFGDVDVNVSQLAVPLDPSPSDPGLGACATSCEARTQVWTLMGQFRSGGATQGFGTLFAAQGGVTAFRNLRELNGGTTIGDGGLRTDISGTLGAGVSYTLSRGTVIELVQDFGMGFHSAENLPPSVGRTWRSRVTRASLRFQFGGR